MASVMHSSRRRYRAYRERVKKRGNDAHVTGDAGHAPSGHGDDPQRKKRPRSRPFRALFLAFWGLLRGHRSAFILILLALGISTLLGLAPLYGTKIVFDGVLREQPLPTQLPAWVRLPEGRRELLTFVVVAMVVLSAAAELIGLWSRWQTTRMTKLMQVSVRKRVFDHAVRLPLH
ncbi:MAG: ABC transporter ATP-binding protein, partial [Planctomycetota bacterium]|nr:ABC transporter ATP-binding protein [Planctomycetota bacterium]